MSAPFRLACPECRAGLDPAGEGRLICPACGGEYFQRDGIWRMLPEARRLAYSRFVREYETVRQAEGRGSQQPEYYRDLPYHDHSGRRSADWAIRARSFDALLAQVLGRREVAGGVPLHILDLGAGCGWLAHRLAARGHSVAAVDLLVNEWDGLGAWRHYPVRFTLLQAEFDCLPLAEAQADLVIFNAALHYSTNYERTLGEALRVLAPGGEVVVMDTPLYRNPHSGRKMVQERQAQFTRQYGFPSNALASENFLTYRRLDELARTLGVSWRLIQPDYGRRWALRPWVARLLRRREPAQFALIVGKKKMGGGR